MRLVMLMLASACAGPMSPPNISVNTTLSTSEIRAGEPVVVTVVARNAGDKTVRINTSPCTALFVVMSQDAVVGPAERFCALSLMTRDLAPGESFTLVGQWIGDAQSGGMIKSPPSILGPGTYTLRGQVLS